jgi:hypothetical protein
VGAQPTFTLNHNGLEAQLHTSFPSFDLSKTDSALPQVGVSSFDSTSQYQTGNGLYPYNLDLGLGLGMPSFPLPSNIDNPESTFTSMEGGQMDLEQYLNLNLNNLAPPTDDLSLDFEAQIQAALRAHDPSFQFPTLAPTPSPSSSDNNLHFGSMSMTDSPFSELEEMGWLSGLGLSEDQAGSMELFKVDLGISQTQYLSTSPSITSMDGKGGEGGGYIIGKIQTLDPRTVSFGGRSESPETIASFILHSNPGSGRGSPFSPSPSITTSTHLSGFDFPSASADTFGIDTASTGAGAGAGLGVSMDDLSYMFDVDMSSLAQDQDRAQGQMGSRTDVGEEEGGESELRSGIEGGWMTGALPFDMVDEMMAV